MVKPAKVDSVTGKEFIEDSREGLEDFAEGRCKVYRWKRSDFGFSGISSSLPSWPPRAGASHAPRACPQGPREGNGGEERGRGLWACDICGRVAVGKRDAGDGVERQ